MAREITLTRGKVALVDDGDFDLVSQFKWHARRSDTLNECWYAERTVCHPDGRRTHQSMHRLILGATATEEVDHRDGDGLNNQRANVRLCTRLQNVHNRSARIGPSGFRGVEFRPTIGDYRARICIDHKTVYLGCYATGEAAARAYDRKALEVQGEFARLNFPVQAARAA